MYYLGRRTQTRHTGRCQTGDHGAHNPGHSKAEASLRLSLSLSPPLSRSYACAMYVHACCLTLLYVCLSVCLSIVTQYELGAKRRGMSSPQSCAPSFSPRRDEGGAARSHKRRRASAHAHARTRALAHAHTLIHLLAFTLVRVCLSLCGGLGGWVCIHVSRCAYMFLRNRLTESLNPSIGHPFSGVQMRARAHARTNTSNPLISVVLSLALSFSLSLSHSLSATNRSSRLASPASSVRSSHSISPRLSPPSSDGVPLAPSHRSHSSRSSPQQSPQRLLNPPSPLPLLRREAEEVTCSPESPTYRFSQRSKTFPYRRSGGHQSQLERIEMI